MMEMKLEGKECPYPGKEQMPLMALGQEDREVCFQLHLPATPHTPAQMHVCDFLAVPKVPQTAQGRSSLPG